MRTLLCALCATAVLGSGCVSYDPVPDYTVQPTAARPSAPPLSKQDVVKLTKSGVSADIIVAKVKRDGVSTTLSSEEIIELKNEGVSDSVIQAMLAEPNRTALIYRYYYSWPWGCNDAWYGWHHDYWDHHSWDHHGSWHHWH